MKVNYGQFVIEYTFSKMTIGRQFVIKYIQNDYWMRVVQVYNINVFMRARNGIEFQHNHRKFRIKTKIFSKLLLKISLYGPF